MKNQSGITAITLMITIVIMILLAAFSLLNSRDVVIEGNIAKVANEIKIIKEAADQLSLDESYITATIEANKISDVSVYNSRVGNLLEAGQEYYYLPFGDDMVSDVTKQTLNEALDVRSVENSYIFSIVDVGEVNVYLVDGFKIDGITYYSYEDIVSTQAQAVK